MNYSKEETLKLIHDAATAYYNNETPILTDEEYDKLLEYAELNNFIEVDTNLNDGAKIDNATIKHKVPMLSLLKAKTREEVTSYFNMVKKVYPNMSFIVTPKLDGLAFSIEYSNGKPILAKSRGNGEFGEDLTYLLNNPELKIDNLPYMLENKEITELRGELFCPISKLEEINTARGIPFKNERIAAAGLVKKSKLGLGYNASLTFIPYFAYKENIEIPLPNNIITVDNIFPENESSSIDDLMKIIEEAKEWRSSVDVPTDGIVIKPSTVINNFGATGHHPKQFIAFKYPGEEKTSKVINVKWQIGKTGKLTPVAEIIPVFIDNVEIKNITLHNLDWLTKKNIKIGSEVSVARGNDVIPVIRKVLNNDETTVKIVPPSICSGCGNKLTIEEKIIYCSNFDCPLTRFQRVSSYVGKAYLDIEELNTAVLEVINPTDLVSLLSITLQDLENLKYSNGTSLGKSRANKIYSNIQNAKMNTKENIWLSVLDIPNVGPTTAKNLLSHYNSIPALLNSNKEDLIKIQGVGETLADNIVKRSKYALDVYNKLIVEVGITPIKSQKSNGFSFAVTGKVPSEFKNRDEFVKQMELKGYTYHSSVKKDTSILITDNPNSTSNKIKNAKKNGTEIKAFLDYL